MVVHLCGCRLSSTCLLAFCVLLLLSKSGGTSVGVVYGTSYDKLPTPGKAVQLLKRQQITKVRLLNVDSAVLRAFANTSIEVMVGVPNLEVMDIGKSLFAAFSWVRKNILTYISVTNITAIAVGSEVITTDSHLRLHLVPACRNIHAALLHFGLDALIKVSSPQSMLVLESRFPPSSGRFNNTYSSSIMQPFLSFLRDSGSFFMVNVYPIYFYESMMQEVDLDFALLQPNQGVDDPKTRLHYSNMFDAMVDAVYAAMAALNYSDLQVVVTETGWPSKRHHAEMVMSVDNAATYINNIIRHILNRIGTPAKPGVEIVTFIYELFNEVDMRAPSHGGNWGLFQPNGSQIYGFNMTAESGQVTVDSSYDKSWCIAKEYATPDALQAALDWACGFGGADCNPIQLGQRCYVPNSVYYHASYAFNSYYQIHQQASGTCDFGGTATITDEDPSTPGCFYPFRAGQVGAPIGGVSMMRFCPKSVWLMTSVLVLLYLLS